MAVNCTGAPPVNEKVIPLKGGHSHSPESNGTSLQLYHERQSKQMCAMHTLNNLFQQKEKFTKQDLDRICTTLSPKSFFNPHRTIFGTGNYDVNVIIAALQQEQYEMKWFDKRKPLETIEFTKVFGFIVNRPSEFKFGGLILPLPKHWLAMRSIEGVYYNLDSKLTQPMLLGSEAEARVFVQRHIDDVATQIFVVVSEAECKDNVWQSRCCE